LGPVAKAEEIRSSLSVVGKSLFLPSSLSLILHLFLFHGVPAIDRSEEGKKDKRRRKRGRKKKGKKRKKMILVFKGVVDIMSFYLTF
jgi:hypothetical protein